MILAAAALLALPASARADFEAGAALEARGGQVSPFALDAADAAGGGTLGGARLRLDALWRAGDALSIGAQADVISGALFGAFPELAADGWTSPTAGFGDPMLRVDPRHLHLSWVSPVGVLRLGQMGSHWGLGLMANGGERAPLWGAARHGDLVDRILFATKPLRFAGEAPWMDRVILALGADAVYRDENAELLRGDLALQVVGSLVYREQEGAREVGLYVAWRNQTDRPDVTGAQARLEVLATDVYGAWRIDLSPELALAAAGEAALLTGHTTRLRPDAHPDGVGVLALGWAARAGIAHAGLGLSADVWAGYASGDGNSEDGELRRMRFDPDFRPSLVLFETVLSGASAHGLGEVTDPARSAVPASGSQFLPTGGSVTGALFAGPVVTWDVAATGLSVKGGLMYAEAPAGLADPWASFAAGGEPMNQWGASGDGRTLGLELDLGLGYRRNLGESLTAGLSLEYGVLFPGDAFEMATGRLGPVHAFYGAALLSWSLQ